MECINNKITLEEFNKVFEKYADDITEHLTSVFELMNNTDKMANRDMIMTMFSKEFGNYSLNIYPKGTTIPFSALLEIGTELNGHNAVRNAELYNSVEVSLRRHDIKPGCSPINSVVSTFTTLAIPKYNKCLFGPERQIEDIMILAPEIGFGKNDAYFSEPRSMWE